jgi:hypothetical protein
VTGEWRKLLHNLYSSPGHVSRMGQWRKVYKLLVGKPEGKRPLERPRLRREGGIRMDLREAGGGLNWIRLAKKWDRWRTAVICRWIYIDTFQSINIDTSRWIHIDISRAVNIDISRSINVGISIAYIDIFR